MPAQTPEDNDEHNQPIEPASLTWALLLGRWTDFAKSALALPQQGQTGRVRQSVADIITLQAVWFSLQHLDELDPAQRALGLSRAGLLIDRHAAAIRSRFAGEPLPDEITDLITDAEQALSRHKSL